MNQWIFSAFADEAGTSCDEQIQALKRGDLHAIDIRSIDGLNITALPPAHAREIRKKLDDAAIRINMYGSPIGKIDVIDDLQLDLEKLHHLAELAPILECNAVRIFSYYNAKKNLPHEEFAKHAIERLSILKKTAAALGLVLYHENESHIYGDKCADVQAIAAALREKNDKHFKMIFDFGNYNAAHENVWENWLLLRDATDALHAKDNLWIKKEDKEELCHMPAGSGGGDIPRILADARARGWSGPITLEPHLQYSKAVMATGPSGVTNQAYAAMNTAESFQIACDVLRKIIGKL